MVKVKNKLSLKIKKGRTLIIEGRTIKDKIKIILCFLTFLKYKPKVYLKNNYGIFFIDRNPPEMFLMSSLGDSDLVPYFDLNKGIFLDIGANVGKFSILVGKKLGENGKVFAFEPEINNLKILKKNILINKIKNIEIIPLACSDKKGFADFFIDLNSSGGHSLYKNKSSKKISIETDTIDHFLKNNNIKKVDLVKIDVEGAEILVLKGAKETLKKNHPKIIFEAWNEDYLSKIKKFLKPFNYRIDKINFCNYLAY